MNIHIEPPNERQKLFFASETKYTLYGGARGGGKSWAVRRKALLLCARYPGIRILIVRRTFPELYENHVLPLQQELHGLAEYRDKDKSFSFPNGSRIKLGYCANEGDVLQYQGQEYDIVCIDEATQMTEFQFNMLKAIIRGVNDFPKRMYLTANPGGVGHAWCKRLFIDKQYRGNEREEEYSFIPARVYDNTALMDKDPDYVENLKSLPEDLRKAHLEGDWNVFAGQYFSEWDPDIHVIAPFAIPPSWCKYFTMDYGLDMLAAYWIAIDEYGKEYVYKEIYQSNLIVSDAAKLIKQYDEPDTQIYFAPPDMWNRRNDTGKSVSEIFSEYGIYLSRARNERVMGWYNMKEHLKPGIDEFGNKCAGLRVLSNCKNLIRCIPLAQHFNIDQGEKGDPNDVKCEPHEISHSLDAIRYFCTGRAVPMLLSSQENEANKYDEEVETFLNFNG